MKRLFNRMLPALALTALVFGGTAGAHAPNANASCNAVHDDAELTLPPVGPAAVAYVDKGSDAVSVWQESNSWPGLQTHAHRCTDKSAKRTRWIKADSRLV